MALINSNTFIRLPFLFDYCNATEIYRSRITLEGNQVFIKVDNSTLPTRTPKPKDFTDSNKFVNVNDLGGFVAYSVPSHLNIVIRESSYDAATAAREVPIGDNWVRLAHFMAHVRIQPDPVSQPGGMAPTGIPNTPNDDDLASKEEKHIYNTITDSIYDAITAPNLNPADVATPKYVHPINPNVATMLLWEDMIRNIQAHYDACVVSIASITKTVRENDTAMFELSGLLMIAAEGRTIPINFTERPATSKVVFPQDQPIRTGNAQRHAEHRTQGVPWPDCCAVRYSVNTNTTLTLHKPRYEPSAGERRVGPEHPLSPVLSMELGNAGSVINVVSPDTILVCDIIDDPDKLSAAYDNIVDKKYVFTPHTHANNGLILSMKKLIKEYETRAKRSRNFHIMSVYTNQVHTILDQLKSQQIKHRP